MFPSFLTSSSVSVSDGSAKYFRNLLFSFTVGRRASAAASAASSTAAGLRPDAVLAVDFFFSLRLDLRLKLCLMRLRKDLPRSHPPPEADEEAVPAAPPKRPFLRNE